MDLQKKNCLPEQRANVAILVRVSRKDQNNDRQVSDLTEHCKARNYNIVEVFAEKLSGTKTKVENRPVINQLLQLAKSKKINKVIISEVSRLGRRTNECLWIIEQLHLHKVSLYVNNYQLETLNEEKKINSMAQFLVTLLADFARMETATLAERIDSGLDEARRKGKVLGRKVGSGMTDEQLLSKYPAVVRSLKEGISIRKVAKYREVSIDTVKRVKKVLYG